MFGVGECVFYSMADFAHKCHQGFEMGVRTKEKLGEEMLGWWYVALYLCNYRHRESHPCFHGGAEDLVDLCVHGIKGAMFRNKIKECKKYMGRWAVCG